jgi:dienelactone hydrolase
VAEVLLFHHALGLTPGVRAFADELSAAGHTVHTPDFYEGARFTEVADGVAHAKSIGFDVIMQRGRDIASLLRPELVYAGFSLGVVPAQLLAQTRPGARALVCMHSAIPPSEFDSPWPAGVPMHIHTMEGDDLGDVDVARELASTLDDVELFLYAGEGHLFTDRTSRAYDEAATRLVVERLLTLLERVS